MPGTTSDPPPPVPDPDLREQFRRLAASVADLHEVMGFIVANAEELVPGESITELDGAWRESETSLRDLTKALLRPVGDPAVLGAIQRAAPPAGGAPPTPGADEYPAVVPDLRRSELLGPTGLAKTSLLARLRDRVWSFFLSAPRTDEKRAKGARAACDYLEFASVVAGSIVGYERVSEITGLFRQLVGIRAERGS
jgi:hypothetical protein